MEAGAPRTEKQQYRLPAETSKYSLSVWMLLGIVSGLALLVIAIFGLVLYKLSGKDITAQVRITGQAT